MDRPIIFSPESVRATLDGRQTQFRRVVTPQPDPDGLSFNLIEKEWHDTSGRPYEPHGHHGDNMWIMESHALYQTIDHVRQYSGASFSEVSDGMVAYEADGYESIDDLKEHIRLMSDCSFEGIEVHEDKWRAPVYMPRWASRINLRITNVRVERVQDISVADAICEGMPLPIGGQLVSSSSVMDWWVDTWNSINKNRGHGWESNPLVWVYDFEVVK